MDGYKDFQGKTLDEAIREATAYFDVVREKLEIDIVQDAKSGVFGLIGARKAKVRARRVQIKTTVDELVGRGRDLRSTLRDTASFDTPDRENSSEPREEKRRDEMRYDEKARDDGRREEKREDASRERSSRRGRGERQSRGERGDAQSEESRQGSRQGRQNQNYSQSRQNEQSAEQDLEQVAERNGEERQSRDRRRPRPDRNTQSQERTERSSLGNQERQDRQDRQERPRRNDRNRSERPQQERPNQDRFLRQPLSQSEGPSTELDDQETLPLSDMDARERSSRRRRRGRGRSRRTDINGSQESQENTDIMENDGIAPENGVMPQDMGEGTRGESERGRNRSYATPRQRTHSSANRNSGRRVPYSGAPADSDVAGAFSTETAGMQNEADGLGSADAFDAMMDDGRGYDRPEGLPDIPLESLDQELVHSVALEVTKRLVTPIIGEAALTIDVAEGRVKIGIDCGENSGLLIGREGQTLASIQYLASRIIARQLGAAVRVQLDTGDYRERQDEKLRELALSFAERVRATGRPQSTRPLSSYHRRVVHLVLQDDEDIVTRSKGEGPLKRVIILRRRKNSAE